MAKIKTEKQYKAACSRIEELLKVVSNDTPTDDKNFLELDLISDLVADYEEEHFPIETPSLVDVIKLRMYEMGLTQTKLSELLNVSPSRISEYLSGKCEPTLKVAREISRKLNIDENMDIAEKYRVMNIPTFLIFKDGQEKERIVGAVSKNELKNKLEQTLA